MLSRADSRFHRRQPMQSPHSHQAGLSLRPSRAASRASKHFLPDLPDLQARQQADLVSALPSCRGRFGLIRCNMFASLVRSFACSSRLLVRACLEHAVAWGLRMRQCFRLDLPCSQPFATETFVPSPNARGKYSPSKGHSSILISNYKCETTVGILIKSPCNYRTRG